MRNDVALALAEELIEELIRMEPSAEVRNHLEAALVGMLAIAENDSPLLGVEVPQPDMGLGSDFTTSATEFAP